MASAANIDYTTKGGGKRFAVAQAVSNSVSLLSASQAGGICHMNWTLEGNITQAKRQLMDTNSPSAKIQAATARDGGQCVWPRVRRGERNWKRKLNITAATRILLVGQISIEKHNNYAFTNTRFTLFVLGPPFGPALCIQIFLLNWFYSSSYMLICLYSAFCSWRTFDKQRFTHLQSYIK